MKIGIIGAMGEEVAKLIARVENPANSEIAKSVFTAGKLAGQDVVIVESGIGKVNAALAAQVLVDKFGVDCIINCGVAGAIDNRLNIGDIVLSEDTVQHDMDTSYFGDPVGIIPRMKESYFKGDKKLIKVASDVCHEVNPEISIYSGRIASGDQFISDSDKKKWLSANFHAMCAEMEGAAIAQICYLNETPFVIIRAVSDKVDETEAVEYKEFEPKAAAISAETVIHMLDDMDEE